jgi:hypothetical protein
VLPMMAVGLVMHRGMQEGHPSGRLRVIPKCIIAICQISFARKQDRLLLCRPAIGCIGDWRESYLWRIRIVWATP